MSYAKTTIVGNLGGDPEMRYTPEGQAVTSFSVAVNEAYTNRNGEKVKNTAWYRVTAWGKQAETCNQYLKKGKLVLIEGKLIADPTTGGPRIWSKQDGTAASSFEIKAANVVFLSSSQSGEGGLMQGAAELGGEEVYP